MPLLTISQMGLTKDGKILGLESSIYADAGWSMNDGDSVTAATMVQSCYNIPSLRVSTYEVRTDTAPPTATRAPGTINGHAMIEAILEHAAHEIGISLIELRKVNLMAKGDPVMPPPVTLSKLQL